MTATSIDESPAALISGLMDGIRLWCPVPLRTHPLGAEALDRTILEWAGTHGLLDAARPPRWNFGFAQAAAGPFFRDEAAVATGILTLWACLLDDHLDTLAARPDHLAALCGEVLRAFSEPDPVPVPGDRWIAAARDVRRRIDRACAPLDTAELGYAMARSHAGWLWKYALSRPGRQTGVGEYLRMRYFKGGLDVLASLIGPGAGYRVDPGAFHSPLVRAFTHAATWPAVLINDVGSLAKEATLDQPNIVTVLAAEHGIGIVEALMKTMELYERLIGVMLRLQKTLLADDDPGIVRYATELPQVLPATVHFTIISSRYPQAPGDDDTAPRPAVTLTEAPLLWDRADPTPPPYPELAWIWDQAPH
jgi:Terpene synthase family 2, C-terminal metal binding